MRRISNPEKQDCLKPLKALAQGMPVVLKLYQDKLLVSQESISEPKPDPHNDSTYEFDIESQLEDLMQTKQKSSQPIDAMELIDKKTPTMDELASCFAALSVL